MTKAGNCGRRCSLLACSRNQQCARIYGSVCCASGIKNSIPGIGYRPAGACWWSMREQWNKWCFSSSLGTWSPKAALMCRALLSSAFAEKIWLWKTPGLHHGACKLTHPWGFGLFPDKPCGMLSFRFGLRWVRRWDVAEAHLTEEGSKAILEHREEKMSCCGSAHVTFANSSVWNTSMGNEFIQSRNQLWKCFLPCLSCQLICDLFGLEQLCLVLTL